MRGARGAPLRIMFRMENVVAHIVRHITNGVSNLSYVILGILIPFIGTTLGSAFVFFIKKNMDKKFEKLMIGFAAGVMIAASVWSLIIPSIELAEKQGIISWLPATVGLVCGIVFLILINDIVYKIEREGNKTGFNMLMFSVTLHNIPERIVQSRGYAQIPIL